MTEREYRSVFIAVNLTIRFIEAYGTTPTIDMLCDKYDKNHSSCIKDYLKICESHQITATAYGLQRYLSIKAGVRFIPQDREIFDNMEDIIIEKIELEADARERADLFDEPESEWIHENCKLINHDIKRVLNTAIMVY